MPSLIIIFLRFSILKASALVFKINSLVLPMSFPPPIFTFSLATILLSSLTVIPNLFSALISGNILISLSRYPIILIAPTPLIFCKEGLTFSSAKGMRFLSVAFLAVKKTLITDAPPISSLLTSGVLASVGSMTAETLSRTSLVASLMSRSKKNFTITTEAPSELVEVMASTPPIREIASSILSVT